jgi:hypothetical protein
VTVQGRNGPFRIGSTFGSGSRCARANPGAGLQMNGSLTTQWKLTRKCIGTCARIIRITPSPPS